MELVIVDISLEVVNEAFVIVFLIWVLLEVWRQRRDSGDINLEQRPTSGYGRIFTTITVLSNVIISISYLAFGLFEYWNHRKIAPPAAMAAPSATPGYPPGHAHGTSHPIHAYPGAYNQGVAPHAPYGQGYPYPSQAAYPPVVMPPPPQPAPNRIRGCFMACLKAVFCGFLSNYTDPNDVGICSDCFGAGGI